MTWKKSTLETALSIFSNFLIFNIDFSEYIYNIHF